MTQFFAKGQSLTYPLTDLTGVTGVVSPAIGNDHGIAAPTMPGDAGFDAELQEVLDVRLHVLNNQYPYDFVARHATRAGFNPRVMPAPLKQQRLSLSNPKGCANVVHMDNPNDLGIALLDWLRSPANSEGVTLRDTDSDGIPFLNTIPDYSKRLSDYVAAALKKAFEVKYYYGRPRPEEVFMDGICPTGIFTHYPEGCPRHPAYPAGHGAAAGASAAAMNDHFVLTENQLNVVLDSCYLWAMFRTFAGVHYANDNLEGMRCGGYFDI